jgi:hypothetical protein
MFNIPELEKVVQELDAHLELVVQGENEIVESPDQEVLNVYLIYTKEPLDKVRNSVFRNFTKTKCECEKDVCGCMYRANTDVLSAYDKLGIAYYILDLWTSNT